MHLRPFLLAASLLTATLLVACGGSSGDSAPGGDAGPVTLRLGYFPNVTHVQPQVGLARGTFTETLGSGVKLDMSKTFNAGPSAMEALLAGEIDATYVGPSPAINAYQKSNEKELRIVAGATSGGAMLVVRPGANINTAADFANKKVASPQLGNTQDVALRAWLQQNKLGAKENGGNVSVLPIANADALTLFRKGDIDAAWSPEPWASRLVQEAGGKVFFDERTLWPDGKFATTILVVRTSFIQKHPDVIAKLVKAHVETTQWINANPDEAKRLVNQNIEKLTSQPIPQALIDAAWPHQEVTYDPLVSTIQKGADDAFKLGFLIGKKPDLSKLYDLSFLNKVLQELMLPTVGGTS